MKNGIPAHMYYFLLDWKDKNLNVFNDIYEKGQSLNDFTPTELTELYEAILRYEYLDIESFLIRIMVHTAESYTPFLHNACMGADRDVQDCINILKT